MVSGGLDVCPRISVPSAEAALCGTVPAGGGGGGRHRTMANLQSRCSRGPLPGLEPPGEVRTPRGPVGPSSAHRDGPWHALCGRFPNPTQPPVPCVAHGSAPTGAEGTPSCDSARQGMGPGFGASRDATHLHTPHTVSHHPPPHTPSMKPPPPPPPPHTHRLLSHPPTPHTQLLALNRAKHRSRNRKVVGSIPGSGMSGGGRRQPCVKGILSGEIAKLSRLWRPPRCREHHQL